MTIDSTTDEQGGTGPGGLPPTVSITINDGRRVLRVRPGQSLLATLAGENLFMPSACGGNGICSTCKCQIISGGGEIQPAELRLVAKPDQDRGIRLACQLKVLNDLYIQLPAMVFEARRRTCTVESNRSVATFIKELVLALPAGDSLHFQAGGYVEIEVPPFTRRFSEFDIPATYRPDWEKLDFLKLEATNPAPTFRAYSMANHPAEGNRIMLNVRISTPPGPSAPPGITSSYLFGLKPGDRVSLIGPFGEFFIKDTQREMVYIGGGAGMAPLRSHIFDLFHEQRTQRNVSFWYGARSRREIFYEAEFVEIAREHPNFTFHIALNEPLPDDNWQGPVGLIHDVVLKEFLSKHPSPAELEYYLCGPPMMIRSVRKMLATLGVGPEMIAFDAF